MKVERFFHKRCCSQNANQIYNQGNIDEQHWAHKPPPFSKGAIHNRKIAVSTCKNLAFHILKENTIDMKDVKVKSFSNPRVAVHKVSN
jgi:alpha-D-ribose 1-methylphosphonate 5-triphosphate synthase subunit PhnL